MIVRHNSIGSISLCEIYHNWYAKKDQNVITDFGSCLYIPVNFISIFFSYRIRERYNKHDLVSWYAHCRGTACGEKYMSLSYHISNQCASNKTSINTISRNTSMYDVKGAIAC